MKNWVFVDTSAWYAYINRKDANHNRMKEVIDGFDGTFIFSNYVFDELVTLVRMRMGYDTAIRVGNVLKNPRIVLMERISAGDEQAAWELFARRQDKAYSFTDCTSFVLMRRLKVRLALALDINFAQEQFELIL